MTGISGISAGATFLAALGLAVCLSAGKLAAEPLSESPETLSIGIPPQDQGVARQRSVELENLGDGGVVLESDLGQFSLQGGRINPAVGISWGRTQPTGRPSDLAAGRKPADKIELSGGVKVAPDGLGSHRLTGSASFLDLSSFESPAFGEPSPYAVARRSGINDASAFNLMLEGGGFSLAPDLSYRLGYIQRPKNLDPSKEESGFAAGLSNRFDFSTGVSFTPSVEAAHLSDEGDQVSASMLTEWRNWNLNLTYGRRDGNGATASFLDSYEAGASIGYVFDSGVTADLGWERQKTAEELADHIGFQFKYRFGLGR